MIVLKNKHIFEPSSTELNSKCKSVLIQRLIHIIFVFPIKLGPGLALRLSEFSEQFLRDDKILEMINIHIRGLVQRLSFERATRDPSLD